MDLEKNVYEEKDITVEVQRIFAEDKTVEELLLEILFERYHLLKGRWD